MCCTFESKVAQMCENCIERTHLHKHAANKANSGRTGSETKHVEAKRSEAKEAQLEEQQQQVLQDE